MNHRNSQTKYRRKGKPRNGLYAAKLLFQYRVMKNGKPNKRRLCEKRIIHVQALSAREALGLVKVAGKEAQHNFKNVYGNRVFFDFVGIEELLSIGVECTSNEVWYEHVDIVNPKERRAKLLPLEKDLTAIRLNE